VRVKIDISAWRRTKWYEYVIRFAVGGVVTVVAALIAKRFGAAIGGLFLAFPAIFPSTATLIASHEKQKKAEMAMSGTLRARKLAGADAAGATMGGVGLAVFAAAIWWAIRDQSLWAALAVATLAWMLASFLVWEGRERLWRRLRRKFRRSSLSKAGRHAISRQEHHQQN
jgi:uncharacterized membrane protein (GlpM family)